ncbi:MAG: DUF2834 domain-containing protein [Albimonas sp.]|uniref:DUF2834 domain-containing protein n=1 Tax=Albimonas sp. TaxID=1872425 RepID=UPI0040573D2F|tara:strand:- start:889 stop:1236 length:348 start_codon:yes stop_codon:yes gene_type:complete
MGRLGFLWLLLAAVGAVFPMLHFKAWADENGWSWSGLVEAWTVNDATTGMLWDLGLVGVTLTVAILAHLFARRDWASLVCLPVTWGVGVAAGLPLFLWFLTRKPRQVIKARDEKW